MPLMHVDTVGDAIIDTLYAGFGNTLPYPGMLAYLTWERCTRVDFKGRQSIGQAPGKLKA